ncbi:MAG: hypothetical protein GF372_01250 [Candidatus Marinimicrobia bacterium]|nr:hypothetical protein [Candidatus Neomarinimicrobiota bacterium]
MKKAKVNLRRLLFFRIGESLIFLFIVIALWGYMVNHVGFSAPVISATILNVFSHIGLIGSITQIVLIARVDYSEPVLAVQERIAKVQSHGIQLLRLLFLSVPFYLAYIFLGWELLFGFDLFLYMDSTWFSAQLAFSALLIVPILWFVREINKKDPDFKWVRHLRENAAGRQTVAAAGFLSEINNFTSEI